MRFLNISEANFSLYSYITPHDHDDLPARLTVDGALAEFQRRHDALFNDAI